MAQRGRPRARNARRTGAFRPRRPRPCRISPGWSTARLARSTVFWLRIIGSTETRRPSPTSQHQQRDPGVPYLDVAVAVIPPAPRGPPRRSPHVSRRPSPRPSTTPRRRLTDRLPSVSRPPSRTAGCSPGGQARMRSSSTAPRLYVFATTQSRPCSGGLGVLEVTAPVSRSPSPGAHHLSAVRRATAARRFRSSTQSSAPCSRDRRAEARHRASRYASSAFQRLVARGEGVHQHQRQAHVVTLAQRRAPGAR